jgi:hypothetical protein
MSIDMAPGELALIATSAKNSETSVTVTGWRENTWASPGAPHNWQIRHADLIIEAK